MTDVICLNLKYFFITHPINILFHDLDSTEITSKTAIAT